jgi:environmental stress-induced protein Ves
VRLLRARDYVRTPWKNGGGSTLEVCRDAGCGLEGFGWRLSIADIAEAGPFSTFEGYARVITVLEGEGMVLTVDGAGSGPLHAFQPFAFPGASEVDCALINGPIRDFNLIYSPARYHAELTWLNTPCTLEASKAAHIVFATEDRVDVMAAGNSWQLGRYDTLLLPAHACVQVSGHCCLIALAPR